MTLRFGPTATRLITTLVAVASLLLAGSPASVAHAAPDRVTALTVMAHRSQITLGPARATLDSTQTAIPVGGRFSYRATVRIPDEIDFLQVRAQLFMPESRKLIYQKTYIESAPDTASVSFTFERGIGDIDLDPGAYPLEVSVKMVSDGKRFDAVMPATVFVYDPHKAPIDVALITRVTAVPLTDPDGGLEVDPARFTRARDDVDALCSFVLAEPRARLTLAVSPLTLEEWRRVSRGYRYEGPEGTSEVASDSPVPRAYAATLARLRAAVDSGRLELIGMGYADPSLSDLAAVGLLDDVGPQYDLGLSRAFAAVETTMSTGTAPATGSMSEAAGKRLYTQGTRYTVVRTKWSRSGRKAAQPGAYRARGSALRVLVSDDELVRTLAASLTADTVQQAYAHYLETSGTPLPISIAVGPDAAPADNVISFARSMLGAPWASPVTAREAADIREPVRVRLIGSPADKNAPSGHWKLVADARRWSRALGFALGVDSDEARSAERDSLIAESYAWSGTAGAWEHAERSLAYATRAQQTSHAVLDRIGMSAKPVTLAGTRGEVPITIANRTGRPVKVRLVSLPSNGVSLGASSSRTVMLQPQENFIEVPVDLRGGLSGSLRVRLLAGEVRLQETNVALKASIIDKLVILGGIVVVLVGLLAFIITRVRAGERDESGADRRRHP